uniref:uncharacterized protein LOC100426034 n=1 Tax=Macaca mulatta TaxID=9544 RepID=UPI0010A22864|nr:uncharacterized protein LOC100426034 [Macaca mulatta]
MCFSIFPTNEERSDRLLAPAGALERCSEAVDGGCQARHQEFCSQGLGQPPAPPPRSLAASAPVARAPRPGWTSALWRPQTSPEQARGCLGPVRRTPSRVLTQNGVEVGAALDPRAPACLLGSSVTQAALRFSLCKPKQLLASPSRGPFKRGRGFSLARGTLPACRPLRKPRLRFVRGPGTSGGVVRASLAEAAVVSVCWWRNRQVLVEEQADLGGFSTWLQMTRFHPFLWLKNIPFWMYIAVSSSLHQWMNRVTQRREPKWNVGSTFYNTRDRATMDEEGYIWFLGRSHDTINASGSVSHEPRDGCITSPL